MIGRIRTVKPEIFSDEKLWDLSIETGLPLLQAFEGLWCYADREGRFEWRPRALKTLILPYWEGDFAKALEALERGRHIVRYRVGDQEFGYVRNFGKHQVINQREAKSILPVPPGNVQPSETLNVPAVTRETVFARDGRRCLRCGSADALSIDHIFPRSMGGTHALANLRTLCRRCNSGRPVAGQALVDDLAIDGLTLGDMQRICTHVQDSDAARVHPGSAPGEGNGRELNGTEGKETRAPERELPEVPGLEIVKPAPVFEGLQPSKRDQGGSIPIGPRRFDPAWDPNDDHRQRGHELGLTDVEILEEAEDCRRKHYPHGFLTEDDQFFRELKWLAVEIEKTRFKNLPKSQRDDFETPGHRRRA